ncbi:hypothetical protein GOV05_00385 [Candidatus Woesearchaeota archaeon]|nr:hypothetical protein [Candidatus Woesearchaeota archaeon]
MAKKRASKRSSPKGKKKWFSIYAPDFLGKKFIGETPVLESNDVLGKKVKTNLMTLTGDFRKQNMSVRFVVVDVKESSGFTTPTDFFISPSLLKKYVRRRRDRLDESLVLLTKDSKKVRVKPFVLTRNKIKSSQKSDMRKLLKLELKKVVESKDYLELFSEVVDYKLQKVVREKLSKIVPIKNFEIRVINLEKETAVLSPMPGEEPKPRLSKKKVKDDDSEGEEVKAEKEVKPEEKAEESKEVKAEKKPASKTDSKKEDAKPKKEEKVETAKESKPKKATKTSSKKE